MKEPASGNCQSKKTPLRVPIDVSKLAGGPRGDDEYHNEVARLISANLNPHRKGKCNKLAFKKHFCSIRYRGRQWAGHDLLVTEIYYDSKQYPDFQAWRESLPTIFERITKHLGI